MKIGACIVMIVWGVVGASVPPFDWQTVGCIVLAGMGGGLLAGEIFDRWGDRHARP